MENSVLVLKSLVYVRTATDARRAKLFRVRTAKKEVELSNPPVLKTFPAPLQKSKLFSNLSPSRSTLQHHAPCFFSSTLLMMTALPLKFPRGTWPPSLMACQSPGTCFPFFPFHSTACSWLLSTSQKASLTPAVAPRMHHVQLTVLCLFSPYHSCGINCQRNW